MAHNIQEICSRPNGSEYTDEEMIFVVERYIMAMKGKEVKINIMKGINLNTTIGQIQFGDQVQKLSLAFNGAQAYFHKHYFN